MKKYILAGISIAILALLKKPKKMSGVKYGSTNLADLTGRKISLPDIGKHGDAIKKVKNVYGKFVATYVEKIYRLETNHFKSGQYIRSGSAGMEVHSSNYPYGWTTPARLWNNEKSYRPIGFIEMNENGTGFAKRFLVFPTVEAGIMSLAAYIHRYQKEPARWYSTIEAHQNIYENKLDQIETKYV